MGKKLTVENIQTLVNEKPNTQMFDTCCVCNGIESHMQMNDFGNPATFELICDECLNNNS